MEFSLSCPFVLARPRQGGDLPKIPHGGDGKAKSSSKCPVSLSEPVRPPELGILLGVLEWRKLIASLIFTEPRSSFVLHLKVYVEFVHLQQQLNVTRLIHLFSSDLEPTEDGWPFGVKGVESLRQTVGTQLK